MHFECNVEPERRQMEGKRKKGMCWRWKWRRERRKLSDRAKNVELWSQAIRCDTCAILAFNSSTPHSSGISHMSWEHIRTHCTCEQITFCSSVSLNRIDVTASTTKINDIVNLTWMALLLWNTHTCASAAHLTFYINRIEIWFDIYSVAADVVVVAAVVCACYENLKL